MVALTYTLYDIQVSGSATPSKTTCPTRYTDLARNILHLNTVKHIPRETLEQQDFSQMTR